MPRYRELLLDDEFEEHQAQADRRVVTAQEALQVWDNGFLARRNVRGAADTRLLIGTTDGGRGVTLVARHIGDGAWLAYAAWETKEADLA